VLQLCGHIWNLFATAGSLWVAWAHSNMLKGRSFWLVNFPQSCSWFWRNLLKLRVEAIFFFLKFHEGNGRKIHLWTDWWHPSGVLLDKFGYRVIYDAHSRLNARLSSVIRDSNWFWGPRRSLILLWKFKASCPWWL
jgi:hypothetical protein